MPHQVPLPHALHWPRLLVCIESTSIFQFTFWRVGALGLRTAKEEEVQNAIFCYYWRASSLVFVDSLPGHGGWQICSEPGALWDLGANPALSRVCMTPKPSVLPAFKCWFGICLKISSGPHWFPEISSQRILQIKGFGSIIKSYHLLTLKWECCSGLQAGRKSRVLKSQLWQVNKKPKKEGSAAMKCSMRGVYPVCVSHALFWGCHRRFRMCFLESANYISRTKLSYLAVFCYIHYFTSV